MQTSLVASRVITKCGGYKTVAEWLGLSISRVYRMTYPKSRGGTGGLIPAEHQQTLLRKAQDEDIALCPDDFFDAPQEQEGESAA